MMRPHLRTLAILPLAALALTGCGADNADEATNAAADSTLTILASTNVYGDIASQIAGDLATVNSVVTSAAQDPHEYEATAQDRLAVDRADLVVKNGGGYDTFMDTLLENAPSDLVVLDAVELSGHEGEKSEKSAKSEADGEAHSEEEGHSEGEAHSDEEGHSHIEGLNEHVWYDFHTVESVAEKLSAELSRLDEANASTYQANLAAFLEKIEGLEAKAETLKATAEGKSVVITEPVPVYLLDEVGLVNKTPEEFSEAVEEGADVPPRVLQQTLDLFKGDVAVLAYNAQTSDATTEKVRETAEDADVPVVDFTETLPEGKSYVEWQEANLDNLTVALSSQ